jgi:hypothetical protein
MSLSLQSQRLYQLPFDRNIMELWRQRGGPNQTPYSMMMRMSGVVVVYLGLIAAFIGVISVVKPLAFLAIHTRRQALMVVMAGLVVVVIGTLLPAGEIRVATPRSQLDQFMPLYQFSEFHSIRVKASKEQAYRAIKLVTADEIRFFRTLVWIRRFGRPGPESILNVPERQPILDVAARTTFLVLAEESNHEIVLGSLVAAPNGWRPGGDRTPEWFKSLSTKPGFALATINFLVEDAGPGECIITTETRVYATDASSRRRFAAYWRVIYPGSALIRREWLKAIAKRAETEARS